MHKSWPSRLTTRCMVGSKPLLFSLAKPFFITHCNSWRGIAGLSTPDESLPCASPLQWSNATRMSGLTAHDSSVLLS
jgi:hypothetical protein